MNYVKYTHPTLFKISLVFAFGRLINGLGFLLLPATFHSSPSFNLIKELLPIQAWGALFIFASVIIFAGLLSQQSRYYRVSLAIGMALDLMFTFTFILAFIEGTLAGFPAITLYGGAAAIQGILIGEPLINPANTKNKVDK